ncbi:MAG TPA: 16S rRNA (guanine(966)-N(2))-methyltransferase RsmD, partial [Desulfosalsimonadaceae bacterium]|nr:16S rRNA (guanine(966)-N(2))-methyltransferase RsmD [Desulfosalsimonadaceae bacterium]
MRISGGEFKGRKLFSVRGSDIRPSGGKLREAVFSIAADFVAQGRVLDLYAGTGSLGLEALSRGARRAVFIDNDQRAISAIRDNIQLLRVQDRTTCIRWDITKNLNCLQAMSPPFTLVFIDPPY